MCQSPGSLPSVPKSFDSKRISLPWIHTWCVWVRRHSVRLVEIPSFHRLIWGSEMKTCLKGSDKTITTIRKRSEMRKRWAQRMYHNAKALYSSLLDMRSKEIQPHVLVHDPSTKFKIQPFKQIWARAGLPKVCLATPPRQQTYLHARTCSHHFAPGAVCSASARLHGFLGALGFLAAARELANQVPSCPTLRSFWDSPKIPKQHISSPHQVSP